MDTLNDILIELECNSIKVTEAGDRVEKLSNYCKRYHFDSWDSSGGTQTIEIIAESEEDAELLMAVKYPDLGFDPPYTN